MDCLAQLRHSSVATSLHYGWSRLLRRIGHARRHLKCTEDIQLVVLIWRGERSGRGRWKSDSQRSRVPMFQYGIWDWPIFGMQNSSQEILIQSFHVNLEASSRLSLALACSVQRFVRCMIFHKRCNGTPFCGALPRDIPTLTVFFLPLHAYEFAFAWEHAIGVLE